MQSPADAPVTSNVAGNARITGSLGAVIFVLLFVEGLTVVRVRELISLHVFVGMLLASFVLAKIASTMYRFARYYVGQRDYVDKGPPPLLLRALGPVVTVTTIALFATGIAAVLDSGSRWFAFAHKASFIMWFAAMTLHVLGHALETPALAFADWRRSRRRQAPGAAARFGILATATVVGIPLAFASLHWAHHWHQLHR
ncbi:MAG TPA: hypothetical protein VIK54_16310 [Acidimicrobiia bacterium]